MDKVGFERFDGYEIEQVVERKLNVGTDDGYYICEPCKDIEKARLAADYRSDFWTLYGHLPSGGAIAIGDFKTEDAAMEVLARSAGHYDDSHKGDNTSRMVRHRRST